MTNDTAFFQAMEEIGLVLTPEQQRRVVEDTDTEEEE